MAIFVRSDMHSECNVESVIAGVLKVWYIWLRGAGWRGGLEWLQSFGLESSYSSNALMLRPERPGGVLKLSQCQLPIVGPGHGGRPHLPSRL